MLRPIFFAVSLLFLTVSPIFAQDPDFEVVIIEEVVDYEEYELIEFSEVFDELRFEIEDVGASGLSIDAALLQGYVAQGWWGAAIDQAMAMIEVTETSDDLAEIRSILLGLKMSLQGALLQAGDDLFELEGFVEDNAHDSLKETLLNQLFETQTTVEQGRQSDAIAEMDFMIFKTWEALGRGEVQSGTALEIVSWLEAIQASLTTNVEPAPC